MNTLLSGKKVLITGASRGIGKAIAHLFAQQGAEIFLNGRNETVIAQLKDELVATYSATVHLVVFALSANRAAQTSGGNLTCRRSRP